MIEHEADIPPSSEGLKTSMVKSGKQRKLLLWLSVSILALITLLIISYLFWHGKIRGIVAFIPGSMKTQTAIPTVGRESPTPTRARLATPTEIHLPPATPSPSRVSKTVYTFIPAIMNGGIPEELPPSTTTNTTILTTTPLSPAPKVRFSGKTILVDISEQRVYAYEGGKLIFNFIASTGRNNSTPVGRYRILDKNPRAYSDPWGFWMPYWMGFDYVGYNLEDGFHSLPVLSNGAQLWGKKIGSPITYGCVVLRPNDMKKLYRWAGIGTTVVIRR